MVPYLYIIILQHAYKKYNKVISHRQIIKQINYTHHHNLYQILNQNTQVHISKTPLSLINTTNSSNFQRMQAPQNNTQLTPQQYESVLKYMQTTNEQNYEQAVRMLKAHQFSLQSAVNTKLGLIDSHHSYQHNQNNTQNHMDNSTYHAQRTHQSNQNIKKYIQYLRDKQNRSIIMGIFSFTKNLLFGLISGITQLILPEILLQKIMRSKFYNLYRLQIPSIEFKDKKLSHHIKNTYLQRKPIMFVVSAPNTIHKCYLNLFNQPSIYKKINQSFIFTGSVSDDKECEEIYKMQNTPRGSSVHQQQNNMMVRTNPPEIIICRKNLFQKIEIVKKFTGEQTIKNIDVHKLNYVLRDHQRANRKDKNLLVKYRNYIRRNYYGARPGFYEQEQQEQQLYHYSNEGPSHTETIHKQNQQYKKVQQQTRRKQSLQLLEKEKQLQQQRLIQQKEQERKVRKMSIPEQPKFEQGRQQEIIRFNFRCPQGKTITRNFYNNQKLDLIYHWVETNDQIQFQDNVKRHFELLHGFPPSSLGNRKDQLLKDIFDSDQQKIMIREL